MNPTLLSRRRAVSAAAVISFAALGSVSLGGCDRVPDTIKIGVAQPLSGDQAGVGKDLANGVQIAIEELNASGLKIKGKLVKFEMVAVDDKADPEEGKKVAAQLVGQGVVAVIGHLNSGVSIPAAPIYAEKGIAQLTVSTNPQLTQLGHATTLRIVANDNLQARAVGAFAAEQVQGSKYAVVDDGSAYGKGLAEDAAKQLAGKKTIVIRQSFDDKTKDFAALADKIKADGVEVIVSTLNDFQVVALIEALKKIGYNKSVTILGTDTLKTSDLIKVSGDLAGLYCTSPVLEASELPGGVKFAQAFNAKFSAPIAYGAHYTYDAMHAIAGAIRRSESADPKTITETLRKNDNFAPVTGSFKWNEKGELRYAVVSVYTVRNGNWESIVRSDSW
jgi:branched-chain amino acid transport system substrate-binding protein